MTASIQENRDQSLGEPVSGASLRETGSKASPHAPAGHGPTGYDSARLLALAELCEAAAEADCALDDAIWLAAVADGVSRKAYDMGLEISKQEADFRLDYMSDGARYTASLDSAMTLVPEGLSCSVAHFDQGGGQASVWGDDGKRSLHGAETAALALCAAALKARAGQ